ncbi:PASTA domain-containing protein [Micromonospora sp. NPDC093277]|uniref:PASTA domain-containing protein n=1 Tax=Micromonospora sp. NPDC093277 TaxID=3364291 RepID=UPI0038121C76
MSDDHPEPPAGDADATRPLHRDGEDATRPLHRDGEDATARQAVPAAWSGRAGVPPPRPAGYAESGTEWYAEEQADRRWWMPILLGIVALALIALIGFGVWLSLRATERDPGPAPASSAVPSTAPETSAAPTTTAPSPSPSTAPPSTPPPTTATQVPMPPLVGLPEATARALLDRLGLAYQVERRTSDRPAGTVIETDPAAGEPVAEGEDVTIVVAETGTPTTGASRVTSAPTVTPTP